MWELVIMTAKQRSSLTMKKTYPPTWKYRHLVYSLYPDLQEDVNELKAHWTKEGQSGLFLHFRGTNTKKETHINDRDIASWFIAIANRLDRPIHPIITGVRNPAHATDHFHTIIGLQSTDNELEFFTNEMNRAWKQGTSRVMLANLEQKPFSPLEYIPGKHNWTRGERNAYVPRRLIRLWSKK